MRLALAVGFAASFVLLAIPTSVGTATFDPEVNIEFSAYRPSQLDVLPGETVSWTNVSQRIHTVTSDTGLFDSGDVVGGAHFSHRFDGVGVYAYHCTIHPGITGEIDVRRVTLDRLPPSAVPVGRAVEFSGRTADPSRAVDVQRLDGSTWSTVATAVPAADRTWTAHIEATSPGDYRAVSGPDASETRRLLVSVWKVALRRTRAGVDVTVTPSVPYAPFLVELKLRERFGWWPAASGKLDYVSSAEVRVAHRPARIRVVLVDKDGWTPLAKSRAITLR